MYFIPYNSLFLTYIRRFLISVFCFVLYKVSSSKKRFIRNEMHVSYMINKRLQKFTFHQKTLFFKDIMSKKRNGGHKNSVF